MKQSENAPSALGLAGANEEPAPYRHRRVHCIEDNETNVELMRGVLALHVQVRLTVCTLGPGGLSAVREKRPNVMLLDMQRPDISGLELLRHSNKATTWPTSW